MTEEINPNIDTWNTSEKVKKIENWKQKNMEHINLSVPKGTKERWRAAAEKAGMSMTAFVLEAVEAKIAR